MSMSIECGKGGEYVISQQQNFKPVGWMGVRKSPRPPSDLCVVFMEGVEWPSKLKICEFLTKREESVLCTTQGKEGR